MDAFVIKYVFFLFVCFLGEGVVWVCLSYKTFFQAQLS